MASITLPSLATVATATTAAAAATSAGLGIANAVSGAPKAAPVLAMPNPNDPAIMNQQRLNYALTAGKSGRSSTDLSGGGSPNFSQTTAGSG